MEGSIHLQPSQRKTLLNVYRKTTDPAIRLRAHILLLLAEGYTWSLIAGMLYTSTHTIHRCKHRFEREGLDSVLKPGGDDRWSSSIGGQPWSSTG